MATERPRHYVLDADHSAIPCDMLAWARYFERADRRVAFDQVGEVDVSTVFLGLDHNYMPDDPPAIFETMAFGGAMQGEQERYATWDEATAGHARFVERARWLDRCRLDGTPPAREGAPRGD